MTTIEAHSVCCDDDLDSPDSGLHFELDTTPKDIDLDLDHKLDRGLHCKVMLCHGFQKANYQLYLTEHSSFYKSSCKNIIFVFEKKINIFTNTFG